MPGILLQIYSSYTLLLSVSSTSILFHFSVWKPWSHLWCFFSSVTHIQSFGKSCWLCLVSVSRIWLLLTFSIIITVAWVKIPIIGFQSLPDSKIIPCRLILAQNADDILRKLLILLWYSNAIHILKERAVDAKLRSQTSFFWL